MDPCSEHDDQAITGVGACARNLAVVLGPWAVTYDQRDDNLVALLEEFDKVEVCGLFEVGQIAAQDAPRSVWRILLLRHK